MTSAAKAVLVMAALGAARYAPNAAAARTIAAASAKSSKDAAVGDIQAFCDVLWNGCMGLLGSGQARMASGGHA